MASNRSAGIPPAEFLKLVGHPLRWRLLSELSRCDRVVRELTRLVDQPQNLVSYHLARLREAGLVFARQSDLDRRDNYYGLNLPRVGDLLSATGSALHPGLRLVPAAPESVPLRRPIRVLFLCTGNSARSQMAEALARSQSRGAIEAHSAGSHPKPLHPNALRVMREDYALDLAGHASKHLQTYTDQSFDWIVSLCDRVRERCPELPGQPEMVHWSVANPVTGDPDEVTYPLFRQTAAELATRVGFLLRLLLERANKSEPERNEND